MGCYSFTKALFIILNVIFLLLGLSAAAAIAWMWFDPAIPLQFTQEPYDFMIAIIIYAVVAAVLILLAILGIMSAVKEIRCMLVLSFSLLLIIIVVEVASAVWIYMNQDDLDKFTRNSVKHAVKEQYGTDYNVRRMFDAIQSKMECCGADGPSDWSQHKSLSMGVTSDLTRYTIPASCCQQGIPEQQCSRARENMKIGNELNHNVIFKKGCYDLIKQSIVQSLNIILSVFGTILAIKLLGLVLGLILAFSMKRSNRYKA